MLVIGGFLAGIFSEFVINRVYSDPNVDIITLPFITALCGVFLLIQLLIALIMPYQWGIMWVFGTFICGQILGEFKTK